jgi:hypothetical protein
MNDYQVTDLMRRVRTVIDMNPTDTALTDIGNVETLNLDDIIRDSLVPAAQLIELRAPIEMLGVGKMADTAYTTSSVDNSLSADTDGNVCHTGKCPTDFMRLVFFKMKGWARAVTDYIAPNSPLYAMQRSRVAAVRGCPDRPIFVVSTSKSGNNLVQTWEAYTAPKAATVETFAYLPIPTIVDGTLALCPLLVDATVYATAYLAASAYGATAQAQNHLTTALALAGVSQSQQPTDQ